MNTGDLAIQWGAAQSQDGTPWVTLTITQGVLSHTLALPADRVEAFIDDNRKPALEAVAQAIRSAKKTNSGLMIAKAPLPRHKA